MACTTRTDPSPPSSAAVMGRRELIALVAGATVWSAAARAQQPAIPVVGFISPSTPAENANLTAAFRRGLAETGYVEGRNVRIEYRWANGLERVPELVADLMAHGIALAGGGALLRGLDRRLAQETKFPVYVADDPLTCVVRGTGEALEEPAILAKVQSPLARRRPTR